MSARLFLAHAAGLHLASAGPRDLHELWRSWELDPTVIVPLAVAALLYARGARHAPRTPRAMSDREIACFASGWLALAVALVSPIHRWGEALFSAHMVQHEILMLVAAPLLVLGRPEVACLRALPVPWARTLARWNRAVEVDEGRPEAACLRALPVPSTSTAPARRSIALARASAPFRALTNPFAAWAIHALVLWIWHTPALFQSALEHPVVHAAQHLAFLGSAWLFWWAVLRGPARRRSQLAGVLYLFTTALHSGLLGALLALTTRLWYPVYLGTTASWGLTPLEDQQLGGVIMWIPAGLVYLFAALALFADRLSGAAEHAHPHRTTGAPATETAAALSGTRAPAAKPAAETRVS